MPCDTIFAPNQTITDRKKEIKQAVSTLDKLIAANKVRVKVGPQGAVAFDGWQGADRRGITDACAFRRLMVEGSALTKAKVAQAEMVAGRSVNKQVVGQGAHSHDGGHTWHDHKG